MIHYGLIFFLNHSTINKINKNKILSDHFIRIGER